MSLPAVCLSGPRPALDPRIHLARGDVVEIDLAQTVAAGRYTAPMPMVAVPPRTPMRAEPELAASAVSELLHGEDFHVFDLNGEWALGRTLHDRYIGWVPLAALAELPEEPAPEHRITARAALVFSRPDIKAPVLHSLPMGARIRAVPSGAFLALSGGGHVHRQHVAPRPAATLIEVARQFLGAPYLWGGRTPAGVDCSGLVQSALAACGVAAPRDSDQQRDGLGVRVETPDAGDLMFFPGHVGIMTGREMLLHANAHWMAVVEEPLADVLARLGGADKLLAIKRL